MFLLFALQSVFINTNRQKYLQAQSRRLQYSEQGTTTPEQNNIEVVTTDVDGVIQPQRNDIFGYDIFVDNRTFWSDSIYGSYMCSGEEYDGMHFASQPDYNSDSDFDLAGFFLVFFIAVLLFCVVTAQWPTLLSVLGHTSRTEQKIDIVLKNLDRSADGEYIDNEDKPSCCCCGACSCVRSALFAKCWMLIAALCLLSIAALSSQMLCQALSFPNVVKHKRVGKCWFVDTSRMGSGNSSKSRRLMADTENSDIAQMQKKSDGTVTFYSQCGTAYWKTDSSLEDGGAVWTIEPPTVVKCKPVPARRISHLQAYMQSKCTLGSWKEMSGPRIEAPTNYRRITAFTGANMSSGTPFYGFQPDQAILRLVNELEKDGESWFSGLSCGFLNLGHSWRKGEALAVFTEMDNWSFCQAVYNDAIAEQYYKGKGLLRRTGSDGKTQEVTVDDYSIDDNIANIRPYGWYTNGVQEIIVTSTFSKGRKSSVVFEEFATDDGIKQIALDMLNIQRDQWKFTSLQDVNMNPNSFMCRQSFKMDAINASQFEEFKTNCTTAQAIVNEQGVVTITATADGSTAPSCVLEVGYQSTVNPEEITATQVSIIAGVPKQFNGVTHWNCLSGYAQGVGISCGKTELQELGLNVTSSVAYTRVTNPTYTRENNYDMSGFGIDFGPLSNGVKSGVSAITSTLGGVFGGIGAGLLTIGVVVLIGYLVLTGRCACCGGCCPQERSNIVLQTPSPATSYPQAPQTTAQGGVAGFAPQSQPVNPPYPMDQAQMMSTYAALGRVNIGDVSPLVSTQASNTHTTTTNIVNGVKI